ncbi:MAG: hypothetical protein R3F31_20650 [Verrucomicrobiales bacterium]
MLSRQTTGDTDARQTGRINGQGEQVGEVKRQRIGGVVPDPEGWGRRDRSGDDIAVGEGLVEVVSE